MNCLLGETSIDMWVDYLGTCLTGEVQEWFLLIPKPKPAPRSLPMPRSQPMSSYLLYSSLVFHCSQAPISVAAKRLTQPLFLPPPSSAEALLITRRLCIISADSNRAATLDPLGLRTLMTGSGPYWKHHSPSSVFFQISPSLLTCSCSTIPDPYHSCLFDPRSCDLSGSNYYSSMIPQYKSSSTPVLYLSSDIN